MNSRHRKVVIQNKAGVPMLTNDRDEEAKILVNSYMNKVDRIEMRVRKNSWLPDGNRG